MSKTCCPTKKDLNLKLDNICTNNVANNGVNNYFLNSTTISNIQMYNDYPFYNPYTGTKNYQNPSPPFTGSYF